MNAPISPAQFADLAVNHTVALFRREKESSPGRTRTYDPAVNSRLLYQLSYRGIRNLIRDSDQLAFSDS